MHIPPRGRLSRELKSTATKPATKGTTFFRARRELSTQGLNCWGRLSNSRSLIVTAPYIAVCPKTTSVRDSSREENLFVARAENVESGGAYRIVLEAEFAENAPETTRTSDLWFRRPTLYPTELRAREQLTLAVYKRKREPKSPVNSRCVIGKADDLHIQLSTTNVISNVRLRSGDAVRYRNADQ